MGKHTQKYFDNQERQRLHDIAVTDGMEVQFQDGAKRRNRPSIMERARNFAKSRMGATALAATLGLALGAGVTTAATSHEGGPVKALVPAAANANPGNNHMDQDVAAAKRSTAAMGAERQQLQDMSVQAAQGVAHDLSHLSQGGATVSYNHGRDVGAFTGVGDSTPEMFEQWHSGSREITVSSIDMPQGKRNVFNAEQFDFQVSPNVANRLDAEARQGALTARDFERALSSPADLTLRMAQAQNPTSPYQRTLTIDRQGNMTFDDPAVSPGSFPVTRANLEQTVTPQISDVGFASSALEQAFYHSPENTGR